MTEEGKRSEAITDALLITSKAGAMRRLAREFPPRWGPPAGALTLPEKTLARLFDLGSDSKRFEKAFEELETCQDNKRRWWLAVLGRVYSSEAKRQVQSDE